MDDPADDRTQEQKKEKSKRFSIKHECIENIWPIGGFFVSEWSTEPRASQPGTIMSQLVWIDPAIRSKLTKIDRENKSDNGIFH